MEKRQAITGTGATQLLHQTVIYFVNCAHGLPELWSGFLLLPNLIRIVISSARQASKTKVTATTVVTAPTIKPVLSTSSGLVPSPSGLVGWLVGGTVALVVGMSSAKTRVIHCRNSHTQECSNVALYTLTEYLMLFVCKQISTHMQWRHAQAYMSNHRQLACCSV